MQERRMLSSTLQKEEEAKASIAREQSVPKQQPASPAVTPAPITCAQLQLPSPTVAPVPGPCTQLPLPKPPQEAKDVNSSSSEAQTAPAGLPMLLAPPAAAPEVAAPPYFPKAVPLTEEETTRYLDLVEKDDTWWIPGVPLPELRKKWAAIARNKHPEYIRTIMLELAKKA